MATKIIGLGKAIPSKKLHNKDFEKFIETSHEWIDERTGIHERRISDVNTSELAYKASLDALQHAGIDKEEIDLIIISTVSPDSVTPTVASLLQAKLGLNDKPIACFDLNAACTGFIYALEVGTALLNTGKYKTALIVGAEILSKVTDYTDRSTCILFGDGAGAAIMTRSKENKIHEIALHSKGDLEDTLILGKTKLKNHCFESDEENMPFIKMNGSQVFKFAVRAVVNSVKSCLKNNNLTIDDIAYIVPHQANQRIIDHAAKLLKAPDGLMFSNIQYYGNTSSASIPIALKELSEQKSLKKGDKIIMVGFGGGLTWGHALIEWDI